MTPFPTVEARNRYRGGHHVHLHWFWHPGDCAQSARDSPGFSFWHWAMHASHVLPLQPDHIIAASPRADKKPMDINPIFNRSPKERI
jgi:hypothetical protein